MRYTKTLLCSPKHRFGGAYRRGSPLDKGLGIDKVTTIHRVWSLFKQRDKFGAENCRRPTEGFEFHMDKFHVFVA